MFSAILTVLIMTLGGLLSYSFNWGLTGTGYFLVAAGIINFLAFFYSDKILLRIAKAKPLTRDMAPEVYGIVESLTRKMNIPTPKLYLLEDNMMNAFATGRNERHSAIALTRGLIEKMTFNELEAVIAHELSHIQNHDMKTMAVVSIMAGILSIIADLYWSSTLLSTAEERDPSGVLSIIGLVISIFAPLSAFFIQLAVSRKRELVADCCAAHLTKNPNALISALKKISMDLRLPKKVSVSTAHLYFSNPAKDTWIDKLFSTHPPIEQRIKQLEELI